MSGGGMIAGTGDPCPAVLAVGECILSASAARITAWPVEEASAD